MKADAIRLTIDLDAALRKIAKRQTLNDVHFAVQLVRHALTRQPQHIDVRTRGRKFCLQYDGEPILDDELQLLKQIIENGDQHHVYGALTRLEREYGVALLSVLVNYDWVELITGPHLIRVMSGVWHTQHLAPSAQGTRIRIRRPSRQARRENRELRFFCEYADVPITLNGKLICTTPKLPHQILEGKVRQPGGMGWIGIPQTGHLSRVIFLKRGVRFGSQHFLEKMGRVFHAIWNANRSAFEVGFSTSIREGQNCLKKVIPGLYETLASHFNDMETSQKQRVKQLVFSLKSSAWTSALEAIPIFSTPGAAFDLSIADLSILNARFGVVPYFSRAPAGRAPRFPLLTSEDLYFIRSRMRAIPRCVTLKGRPQKAKPPQPIIAATGSCPQSDNLLNALNADPRWHFELTRSSREHAHVDRCGIRRICLSEKNPRLAQARHRFQIDPDSVDLLRYVLLPD